MTCHPQLGRGLQLTMFASLLNQAAPLPLPAATASTASTQGPPALDGGLEASTVAVSGFQWRRLEGGGATIAVSFDVIAGADGGGEAANFTGHHAFVLHRAHRLAPPGGTRVRVVGAAGATTQTTADLAASSFAFSDATHRVALTLYGPVGAGQRFHAVVMIGGRTFQVDPLERHRAELFANDSNPAPRRRRLAEVEGAHHVGFRAADSPIDAGEFGGARCGVGRTAVARDCTAVFDRACPGARHTGARCRACIAEHNVDGHRHCDSLDVEAVCEARTTGSDAGGDADAGPPGRRRARRTALPERWTNCFNDDHRTRTFSIGLAIDHTFYEGAGSDVDTAVARAAELIADANLIYRHQLNIVLQIGHVEIRTTADGRDWNSGCGTAAAAVYGNFDIIFDLSSRICQLHPTPHAPCATPYLVQMLIVC